MLHDSLGCIVKFEGVAEEHLPTQHNTGTQQTI